MEDKKYEWRRTQKFVLGLLMFISFILGMCVQHQNEKSKVPSVDMYISDLQEQIDSLQTQMNQLKEKK